MSENNSEKGIVMKVLVIPDVHLKPYLFTQASSILESGAADQAVCLMDIPDDWGQEHHIERYVETYDAAIAFAKKYPDTLWAYGNHDLCYMWNERESGYSVAAAWTVREKLMELRRALPEGNEIRYIQKPRRIFAIFLTSPPTTRYCSAMAASGTNL